MREILFRGKQKDNGEWIYGSLVHQTDFYGDKVDRYFIVDGTDTQDYDIGYEYEVIPETVGQCTGLKDKNDKKIFDGDIVRIHFFFQSYHPITLGAFESEEEIICKLSITPLGVCFESKDRAGYLYDYLQESSEELEVIGSIQDNPELLDT